MNGKSSQTRAGLFGLLLRAGLFVLFIFVGTRIFGMLLAELFGIFVASALGIFIAAALASAFVVRTFERGRLEDIGMGWSRASLRHLWVGVAGGAAAGLVVMLLPVAARVADIVPSQDPTASFTPGKFVFISIMLLFGATGEEMMFRGYAFQILLRRFGCWWIIPPFGVLFAAAHLGNLNAGWLGLVNTGLWGILLGYAFHRSGDLWLPIGLHFGWNWVLPLFGVNLSGFTIGLTGYTLRWNAGTLVSGGEYGVEGSVLTTAACVALSAWLWKVRLDRQAAPLLEPPAEA